MIFASNVLGAVPPTKPIRIWDAGVTWADLEKTQGVWDWTKLDAIVNAAGTRSVMIVLGHPPAWAAKGGPDGLQAAWMPAGSNRPPVNMTVWRKYVRTIATRYKNRVKCYQVWNEPADKRFYSGSFAELGPLSKAAYEVLKSVDSGIQVVSTPLQPRKQAAFYTKGKQIRQSLASSGFPFDVWACHIYPQKNEGVDAFVRDVTLVKKAIAGYPKKPLWITECNYNLGGTGNPYDPLRQEVIKKLTMDAGNALDISRLYWYAYGYSDPKLIAITNI